MDSLMLCRQLLDLWPCTLAILAMILLGRRVSCVSQAESGPAHLLVALVRLLVLPHIHIDLFIKLSHIECVA